MYLLKRKPTDILDKHLHSIGSKKERRTEQAMILTPCLHSLLKLIKIIFNKYHGSYFIDAKYTGHST